MIQTIQTNSFEETRKVGEEFTSHLSAGDVICLKGDLGAGKTTFMQGLAKGLGITQRIISPTFIILRKYEITLNNQPLPVKYLYHIDLYRTETQDDIKGLGLPEILQETDAIIAIEWSEKLGSLLPKKRWEIAFEWISETQRKIIINKIP